jgi:hypothetical protein
MTEANDKYTNKIRALLEKAESTEYGPERDNLRAKAQELMIKWQVDEWQLDQARAARGESIVSKIVTKDIISTSDFREKFLLMLCDLAGIMGAKNVIYSNYGHSEGKPAMAVKLVGYEIDLRFLEMLFASLMMEAATTLEAKPDPKISFEENIFKLHEAGLNWERVRVLMNEAQENGAQWRRIPGAYAYTDPITNKFVPGASDGGVMRKAYKRYCEENGEEYHTVVNGKRYRESYVHGFTSEIVTRFRATRRKAEVESGAMVLYDRDKAVNDEFKRMFPKLGHYRSKRTHVLEEAASRGRAAARRADLSDPSSRMGGGGRKSLT